MSIIYSKHSVEEAMGNSKTGTLYPPRYIIGTMGVIGIIGRCYIGR